MWQRKRAVFACAAARHPCIDAKQACVDLAFLHHFLASAISEKTLPIDFIGLLFIHGARHIACVDHIVATIATIMKIAIPLCRQRISPLFESAETFMLISLGNPDCEPTIRQARGLHVDEKCHQLFSEETRILLCGALSRQWQAYLQRRGIEVHAFLAGNVEEILRTYLHDGAGGLGQYAMPGCKGSRGGRRRRLGRRNNCECHQF